MNDILARHLERARSLLRGEGAYPGSAGDEFLSGHLSNGVEGPDLASVVAVSGLKGASGGTPTYMPIPGEKPNARFRALGVFDREGGGSPAAFGGPRSVRWEPIPAHPNFNRELTQERFPHLLRGVPEGKMPGWRIGEVDIDGMPDNTPEEVMRKLREQLNREAADTARPAARPGGYSSVPAGGGGQYQARPSVPSGPARRPTPPENPFANEPQEYQDLMRRLGVIE